MRNRTGGLPLFAVAATGILGTVSAGAQVTYQTFTVKKRGVVSSAKLPVFRAQTPVTALANSTLTAFVKAEQKKFLQETDAPPKRSAVPEYSQDFAAKIHLNAASSLISVEVGVSFYSGGAHPGYGITCFNFGKKDGKPKQLALLDFFDQKTAASDVRLQVKDALLNKLHLLKDKGSFVQDGTVSDLTVLQLDNFVVERDGLHFIFSPYEVGSWAEGVTEVRLTPSELGLEFRKTLLSSNDSLSAARTARTAPRPLQSKPRRRPAP